MARPPGDPVLSYDLALPPRILFGWGRLVELGKLARELGTRAFLVSGSKTLSAQGALERIRLILTDAEVECAPLGTIEREPEVADVDRLAQALADRQPKGGDFVLAVGGGSAIDLAKAVAALAVNRQGAGVRDYLEGVGRGLTLTRSPLPILALPTTAGTGSEATKNAVISSFDPPFKKSLRDYRLIPRAVLVDPELTVSLPPTITAYTGMDAITQLIESFISCKAQPVPRAIALEGLTKAIPALELAVQDGANREAREAMSHAALLSGIALANSGLGMAHGVAAALGVLHRIPHGLACAVMLPAALRCNRETCQRELAFLARAVLSRPYSYDSTAAIAFIERIEQLSARIGIPSRLSDLGVGRDQLGPLVQASRGNSMNGNPRPLADAELYAVLEGML